MARAAPNTSRGVDHSATASDREDPFEFRRDLPMIGYGDPQPGALPRQVHGMKRSERERLRHPQPRNVHGFSEAASLGLLPLVPSCAPTPETGLLVPSANSVLRRGLAKFVSATGLYIAFVFGALPRLALPSGVVFALLLTLAIGWFLLMLHTMKRPGHRTLDEMMHGYATLSSGGPHYFSSSEHSWGEGGPPWDDSGVWLLGHEFAVRSPPNRQIDPPGFYPSPHRVGQWELWTGEVWSGVYRHDPWPRARRSSTTNPAVMPL